jgi:hypothetical protein
MPRGTVCDPSVYLESIPRFTLPRRRRREDIEAQSPRCPLCNRIMTAYIGRRGPMFHCECVTRKPQSICSVDMPCS